MQAVITRPDLRDHFVLEVELSADSDHTAAAEALKQAVQGICRVRVDEVNFMEAGTIPTNAPGVRDERVWK
jgi:hypothetical protein